MMIIEWYVDKKVFIDDDNDDDINGDDVYSIIQINDDKIVR